MTNREIDLNDEAFIEPSQTSRFSGILRGKSSELLLGDIRGLDGDDLAAIEALPSGSALLIARSGPDAGARFLLNSEKTVAGRSTRSDIFLDDVTVSRKHAFFIRRDGVFYVQDAVSLNGTYVNQELIEEARLNNGDEVRIGKYRLTFYTNL